MKKPTSRQIVAANLERFMAKSEGLQTQAALGKRAKIAQSHVGRILRQETSVSVDILDALAEVLGVQTWELLTDTESTREAALRRMMFGRVGVLDEEVEKHLPHLPPKAIAAKRIKK